MDQIEPAEWGEQTDRILAWLVEAGCTPGDGMSLDWVARGVEYRLAEAGWRIVRAENDDGDE